MTTTTNPLFDLTGKVALITGGSRGLGREMAMAFARAGADVVIASRKLESCRAAAAEVAALGRRALPVACHVGDWSALDALVETAYRYFGTVDVLVNNAGMSPLYPSLDAISEELWDKVLGVNLKGPFLTDISKAWGEAVLAHFEATAALRRARNRNEIIDAALYFASAASSFTTGAILRVDGGTR